MILGPVFDLELSLTARRKRFYALRFSYGLALLAILAAAYRSSVHGSPYSGSLSSTRVTEFARTLFQAIILLQGVVVVLLTPAMVAGTIAGEVQRKTIHDLLTSDLTSLEIVLGKLAVRLINIAVLMTTGFPILLLTALLGGFDPWTAVGALGAILGTAYFLGALSILASTQTRSIRGALNFTYTLALTWLIVPASIEVMFPRGAQLGMYLYTWIGPINAWVAPSTPFALALDALRGSIPGPGALLARVLWMVGLQALYGSLLIGLAVVCLRPSYRRQAGGRRTVRRKSREPAPRASRRSAPWDGDPMLWKELFAARVPAFYRPVGMLIVLVLGVLLAWSTLDFAVPAFREVAAAGYGVAPAGSSRALFHLYLRIVGTGIYMVYVLGVASDSAAGLTSERENDTWVSLTATPLTGREILRAKMWGAVWGIRHTAAVLVVLWLTGVLAGSVHPLGFVALLVELAAFTGFAATLGTWLSLRARNSMRALAWTMGTLVVVNGGYLLLAVPLFPSKPIVFAGSTPLLVGASLVSYGDVLGVLQRNAWGPISDSALSTLWVRQGTEMTLACLLGTVAYSAAAWGLARLARSRFDAILDRPDSSASAADRVGAIETFPAHGQCPKWASPPTRAHETPRMSSARGGNSVLIGGVIRQDGRIRSLERGDNDAGR